MADKRIHDYLTRRAQRGDLAPSSVAAIRYTLRQWERHADSTPTTWTPELVEEWVCAEHLALTTRKMRRGRLAPYLAWLYDRGTLRVDLTRDLPSIRLPHGTPRDLAHADVTCLLAVAPDDRARLIIVVMAQMGLRCGDLARVRLEDIDRPRRLLHVRGKGGRGEPTYWEPIPDEAWRLIAPILAERRGGPLVASYHDGRALAPGTVSTLVGRWIRAAGLKAMPWDGVSAHALRHTCAQHMLDVGADLRDVQHALGHRSVVTTEIYARRAPAGLAVAMEGRRYLDAA